MRSLVLVAALACLALPGAGQAQSFCGTPAHKVTETGVAAVSVPVAPLALRASILICNSLENTGSPLVKCREDGVAPVMGVAGPGEVLAKGDCITYRAPSGRAVKCISDTAATTVHSEECK